MIDRRENALRRAGVAVLGVGLVLSTTALVYLHVRTREPPVRALSSPASRATLDAATTTLFITFVLLMLFLVGSFVMVRLGRAAVARRARAAKTEYVDAWSQARVTDEQIRAATDEPPPSEPDPPDPEPGR